MMSCVLTPVAGVGALVDGVVYGNDIDMRYGLGSLANAARNDSSVAELCVWVCVWVEGDSVVVGCVMGVSIAVDVDVTGA